MAPERPISSPAAIGGPPKFSLPEWLPVGWSMKVTVRESGKVDKYYTSLSSGFTCRSKPDVMHYIDIERNAGPIALTTSCIGGDNQQMVKTPNRQAITMPAHVQYSMMKVRSNGKQRRINPRTPVGNSPEWLPFGWKMELKTRQSGVHAGYQYKCYIDPLTRSKLYSKKAVFRYLESGEFPTRSRSQKRSMETNSSLDCTSSNLRECNNKKVKSYALAQNTPGDISHDWFKEITVRKANTDHGVRKNQYYTYLSSEFTCRSKPDVMHYIDIERNAGPIALTASCIGGDNQQMVKTPNRQATAIPAHVQYSMMKVRSNGKQRRKNPRTPVGNSPEWLPFGWKMELKTRQSGVHAGHQYKCYIDPLTRSKLYSKKAVFRYLESGEFPTRSRSQKRSMETNSSLDCTSSNLRESNNKKLKSNVYCHQNFLSYVFIFSALAQNAPGDISHDWLKEITVRKANTDHGVRKNQLSIAAGEKILPGTAVRRCLFSGLVPHLNAMMVIKLDELSKKPVLPLRSCFPAQGIQGVDLSCLAQNTERFGERIKKMDVIPPHSVTGGLPKVLSLHQLVRKELIMVNKKLPKMEELENRKLLQSENEELPAPGNIQSEERNLELMNVKLLQPAPSKSRRGRKKRGVAEVDNSQKQETKVLLRPRKAKAFKAITLPVRSSRRLAGLEAGPGISNLPPRSMVKRSEQCPASSIDGTHQSGVTGVTYQTNGSFDEKKATSAAELEFSKMLKCKEPTVEQAPQADQDLEGNPNPGSPLVLPFGDSWPDPCLEFAFKTLTGDIPIAEDTAGIEEYFQQLLVSVKSPSQSSSAPSAFLPSPVNFSQPECHVQHPVHDRRQCSMENGLQGGRDVNNSCR